MLESQDLIDFSIHSWYNNFKHLCLPTILIEIPESLVSKFRSADVSEVNIKENCSQEFIEKLTNALNSLNNCAFVKDNWHAPMDAKVFSFGNQLKVENFNDLSLYFAVSNIISEDFSNQLNIPFYMVLKQWKNIHPASEFRCIVINNVLRGITPRDWPTFYPHLTQEGPEILDILNNFFKENIQHCFPKKNYIFDVILSFPDKPVLVDFGPLNGKTKYYAFNWKELAPLINKEVQEVAPILRFIEKDYGIITPSEVVYQQYGMNE